MHGADRSLNAQIVAKYIDRVSIGMEINRPRILPYGKFAYITHTNTKANTLFRSSSRSASLHLNESVCVRVWAKVRAHACGKERGDIFACHGGRHIEIKIDSIFRRKGDDLNFD